MILVLLFILLVPSVTAVQINQVLYDPVNSETGGEAIELYNPDDFDANISEWFISTDISDRDITFPKNTLIPAKAYFLVADAEWNTTRDNPEWRRADHEETMTLPNADAGIALKNKNGTIIDAVGWGDPTGIKQGHYQGTPAALAQEGNTLFRNTSTENNLHDFIETQPSFDTEQSVTIIVDVKQTTNTIKMVHILDDDLNTSGIQIKPRPGTPRNITIIATIEGTASHAQFLNTVYALTRINSSNNYTTSIPLAHSLSPGNYTISIFSPTSTATTTFAYLPLKKYEIMPKTITFTATSGETAQQKLTLKNLGNIELNLSLRLTDFLGTNGTLPARNLNIHLDTIAQTAKDTTINLPRGAEKELRLDLTIPLGTVQGRYGTVLRFLET